MKIKLNPSLLFLSLVSRTSNSVPSNSEVFKKLQAARSKSSDQHDDPFQNSQENSMQSMIEEAVQEYLTAMEIAKMDDHTNRILDIEYKMHKNAGFEAEFRLVSDLVIEQQKKIVSLEKQVSMLKIEKIEAVTTAVTTTEKTNTTTKPITTSQQPMTTKAESVELLYLKEMREDISKLQNIQHSIQSLQNKTSNQINENTELIQNTINKTTSDLKSFQDDVQAQINNQLQSSNKHEQEINLLNEFKGTALARFNKTERDIEIIETQTGGIESRINKMGEIVENKIIPDLQNMFGISDTKSSTVTEESITNEPKNAVDTIIINETTEALISTPVITTTSPQNYTTSELVTPGPSTTDAKSTILIKSSESDGSENDPDTSEKSSGVNIAETDSKPTISELVTSDVTDRPLSTEPPPVATTLGVETPSDDDELTVSSGLIDLDA